MQDCRQDAVTLDHQRLTAAKCHMRKLLLSQLLSCCECWGMYSSSNSSSSNISCHAAL